MNEFDFIRRLREQTASRERSPRVLKGIGDDATVIRELGDRDLIVTADILIEGIDFYRDATAPELLGQKALGVSLSDIAAMGARPRWSMISFGLPADAWRDDFKESFFRGYLGLADNYAVALVGGDISESKDIVVDSLVIGEVRQGSAVLRSTAQPGDQIFATGTLGAAAAGLKLIKFGARLSNASVENPYRPRSDVDSQKTEDLNSPTLTNGGESRRTETASGFHYDDQSAEATAINSLLLRQLAPQPRVGWGIVLGEEQLATSMIDISDGLSSDLNHLCAESGVGAIVNAGAIPIDDEVRKVCGRRALDPLSLALHGGEDFELLFTVSPSNIARLPKRVDGVTISHIGEITTEKKVRISEKGHVWDLEPRGFEHFANQPDRPA